jgi:hypothetical protein
MTFWRRFDVNTFPLLDTGAVMQYPAAVVTGQGVGVIRFLDGTDQRYLTQGRTFRSWKVDLQLLNENELAALELFFEQQQGDYSSFQFPDPFSGTAVPNCRFAHPSLSTTYTDVNNGSTVLWVMETNG